MPPLKPVSSLSAMAMDVLLQSIVQNCDRLTRNGRYPSSAYLDPLRSGVIAMREEVSSRLPGPLLAEFASRFLENFTSKELCGMDYQIALEMIMDIEIVGLRLKGRMLQHLQSYTGHRFRRLEELDLNSIIFPYGHPISRILRRCCLSDLMKLVYPEFCTDSDLETIGKNCPQLEILEIVSSACVTDVGLRSLSPCSNLRVVNFRGCRRISYLGLNHMLCVHEKLEDFYYGHVTDVLEVSQSDSDIDVSSGLDLSVQVPSMKRVVIASHQKSERALNLQAIVHKFPNLIHLKVSCTGTLNLSALKHLNKLTGLEMYFDKLELTELLTTWRSIKKILTSIGSNITTLTFFTRDRWCPFQQEDLNFILNYCPNIENLGFDYVTGFFVVPAFRKLKVLTTQCRYGFPPPQNDYGIEFGNMSNLESLDLPYERSLQTIKSMMYDHDKFPKLSIIKKVLLCDDDFKEIEQIARYNNLDFRVERHDFDATAEEYASVQLQSRPIHIKPISVSDSIVKWLRAAVRRH